jgi:hypothetical protein
MDNNDDALAPKQVAHSSWSLAQERAFLSWMLVHGVSVAAVVPDLQDGTKLCQLFEALEGRTLKHNPAPRLKVHRVENCSSAVVCAKSVGIRLENIGPEDLEQGNLKLLLGFLWSIVCFYSAREFRVLEERKETTTLRGAQDENVGVKVSTLVFALLLSK